MATWFTCARERESLAKSTAIDRRNQTLRRISTAGGVLVIASMALALSATASQAVLIYEYFDDYGPNSRGLYALNGGAGWADRWGGYNPGQVYDPTADLTWNQTGYRNDDLAGGGVSDGIGFSSRPVGNLGGTAWVSVLADAFFRPSGSILLGFNSPGWDMTFAFAPSQTGGLQDPVITFDDGESRGPGVGPGLHLILLKLEVNYNELGHDRLTAWVDPASLTEGEAGLGAADVSRDGFDALGSTSNFGFSLLNNSRIDTIRISYGDIPSDAKLSEVLVPEPSVLMLVMSGLLCLAYQRRL